jgi:hypothetical protein
MKRLWTEQEIEMLRSAWKTDKPARLIAEEIGRPLQAVYVKAHKLGLPKKDDPNKIHLDSRDLLWLKLNYPHMRTEICTLKLGISLRSCVRIARKLGVEKTLQFMKECQAFTTRKAKESHLRNGTYPPKGFIIPGSEKYRFKPGHSSTRKPKQQST